MNDQIKNYYSNDEMVAYVLTSKYLEEGENTPIDMFIRRIIPCFIEENGELNADDLKVLLFNWVLIPNGRILAGLGKKNTFRSLSNCLRLPSPKDSYSGIMYVDNLVVNSAKRGCGLGTGLSELRPKGVPVKNSSNSSTGILPFAERYSNSIKEVGQDGRRGASLQDLDIYHPEAPEWAVVKMDSSKLTGSNISFKIYKEFIEDVIADEDLLLRFPVNAAIDKNDETIKQEDGLVQKHPNVFVRKYSAKKLWDDIIRSNHASGCPGLQLWDRMLDYDPAAVYEKYRPTGTNACFHPDTLIETVEGRKRIANITEPTYVYSMDENENLCIAKAGASFVSKRNARTLEITLRCGSSIQVTEDHKLYVHDKGWVEAKDLCLDDRIVHLSRSKRGHKYIGIKLSSQGNRDYKMEHRIVFEGVYGKVEEDIDIHHINNDSFDNKLSNLEPIHHNEHAVITAKNHNPQNHQVRDELGKFVTTKKRTRRTHRQLTEDVSPVLVNQHSNKIVHIEEGEITDVYDIQVEETHCLIAEGMVAHNCGEQPKADYDTCRLLTHNLANEVVNPFVNPLIDFDALFENAYTILKVGDTLVDLEIKQVESIIEKIKSDPEPYGEKEIELDLWVKVREMAIAGRRVGCGITGLADMFAGMNLGYSKSLALAEKVMRTIMKAHLTATIDLAEKKGAFQDWDKHLEYEFNNEDLPIKGKNSFFQMLLDEFPELVVRMCKVGRRNVNWSTVAPTGTISIIALYQNMFPNLSAGCEPQFGLWYFRNVKVETDYDFIDEVGIKWKQYPVIMGAFKYYLKVVCNVTDFDNISQEELIKHFMTSPWYDELANDIDYKVRIQMQDILQKYTTSAISSTINLPKDVTEERMSDIYMYACTQTKFLKGITVYRDGSKGNVLNHAKLQKTITTRPTSLASELHCVSNGGKYFAIVIGFIDDKLYEFFAYEIRKENCTQGVVKGNTLKLDKGVYRFVSEDNFIQIDNLQLSSKREVEKLITRLISLLLQHNVDIKTIINQIQKSQVGISNFGSAVIRTLSFYAKGESDIECPSCKTTGSIVFEEGCMTCKNCGANHCS